MGEDPLLPLEEEEEVGEVSILLEGQVEVEAVH